MYISPDLFLSKDTPPVESQFFPASHKMVGYTNVLGKRRRAEDDRIETSSSLKDRISIPVLQRSDPFAMRISFPEPYKSQDVRCYHLETSMPVKPILGTDLPPPKRRIAAIRRHTSPHSKFDLRASIITSDPLLLANSIEPCHRCHRVPRQKKDLQGYINCERIQCRARTCSVCTRECGCGKKVCSSPGCSIEEGEEGTVFCHECWEKRGEGREDSREQEMSG